jgi:putative serine protease PepD
MLQTGRDSNLYPVEATVMTEHTDPHFYTPYPVRETVDPPVPSPDVAATTYIGPPPGQPHGAKSLRGISWSLVGIGSLLSGIAGAALMFGVTQGFGGSGSGHATNSGVALRVSDTRASASPSTSAITALARNGVDATAIYDQVRPSVVTITSTTVARRRQAQGEGTGIELDTNGHILTNNHVVEGASRVQVKLDDGQTYTATVLATDPTNDLAVIGISAPAGSLHPAKLGDPSTLQVGEPVLAIGNPLGYEATLTEGIISGLDRTFDDGQGTTMSHLIQSDAAINPGNSGGPLLDPNGTVVGINTLIDNADGSNAFSGIGFAVPVSAAQSLIQQAAAKS